MANDPRLNLLNFASTLLNTAPAFFGVPHATQCPSVQFRQEQGSLTAWGAVQDTRQVVGAFANFDTGLGTGIVGTGLKALTGVSDTIRLYGNSSLPVGTSSNGQSYVLQQVGIDSQALATASGFNPSVANNAFNAASQVYNSVSQGKFTSSDIPGVFSAFENGRALISSLFSPNSNVSQPRASGFGQNCGASPYAVDLISRAPKFKFLFVVQFEFDPQFQNEIHGAIDPAFVVKGSTRPAVDFEYEPINMYNFRTMVPKKTIYQPITMRFYDDDYNNAMQLYTTYLKLVSPIANLDDEIVKMDPLDMYDMHGGGMGFASAAQPTASIAGMTDTVGQTYPASFGPFGADPSTRNVLRAIRIFHVYRQGRMMNVYNFYNPKITKMELDELDMAESGPTEVRFTFSYDSMYIIPGYRVYNDTNAPQYSLPAMTGRSGLYPLGVDPTAKFNDGNPKDGFGVPYGQDVLSGSSATNNLTASVTNTTKNVIASTQPAPLNLGGGQGNVSVPVGGNTGSSASVAMTPSMSINPNSAIATNVTSTGTTPTSADFSTEVANELATSTQSLSSQLTSYDAAASASLTPAVSFTNNLGLESQMLPPFNGSLTGP